MSVSIVNDTRMSNEGAKARRRHYHTVIVTLVEGLMAKRLEKLRVEHLAGRRSCQTLGSTREQVGATVLA